ncbi:hypothetical protein [Enterococcus olivae]
MKKADEMEMTINFKATRFSWIAVNIFLILWVMLHKILSGELLVIPLILSFVQNMLFFGYKIYLSKKMVN